MRKDTKFYMTQGFFIGWFIFIVLAAVISWYISPTEYFLLISILLIFCSLLLVFRVVQLIFKRIEGKKHDYSQIESLFSLYYHLRPGVHLPPMRNHAGSPDFLNLIIEMLEKHQPKVIVEASSGISSIVISEWLLQNAKDSIHFAMEDEYKYAELTRSRIRNPNSKIVYAPIQTYSVKGEVWKYYSIESLQEVKDIDMVIVDGPPRHLQPLSRYPTLPLLKSKLATKVVVLLDDANREDEKIIANRWEKEFNLNKEFRKLEKGLFIFTSKPLVNSL